MNVLFPTSTTRLWSGTEPSQPSQPVFPTQSAKEDSNVGSASVGSWHSPAVTAEPAPLSQPVIPPSQPVFPSQSAKDEDAKSQSDVAPAQPVNGGENTGVRDASSSPSSSSEKVPQDNFLLEKE